MSSSAGIAEGLFTFISMMSSLCRIVTLLRVDAVTIPVPSFATRFRLVDFESALCGLGESVAIAAGCVISFFDDISLSLWIFGLSTQSNQSNIFRTAGSELSETPFLGFVLIRKVSILGEADALSDFLLRLLDLSFVPFPLGVFLELLGVEVLGTTSLDSATKMAVLFVSFSLPEV